MKKNADGMHLPYARVAIKSLLMFKLAIILLFALTLQSFGRGFGQGKIKLNVQRVELKQALKTLEAQGVYRFVYKDEILPKGSKVSINVENATLEQVLDKMLENTNLNYRKLNEQLVVITKEGQVGSSAPLAKSVSGRVVNEQGTPLAGVTVQEKGTSNGTSTREDGTFSFTVSNNDAVLEVSFVGYTTQTVRVGNEASITIRLVGAARQMDEVVVVGYGTQKKSVVTGAISSVKASDIDNQPIMRVEQFLQGRASGLTIAASSGQPGSASTLRVRGTTSINNSDPLYVVDGIPVDIGGIDYLNPNDIESIEVLKDAASAAIYGARAASGVILVTTKKGRPGSMQVSYNGYYGTQAPARKLKLLNAEQYATLQNEASLNSGGGIKFANPQALGTGTDWQSLIFNNSAKIQDHELSISGGNAMSTYFASFGLFDQQGIVATPISDYKRFNVRLNATHKVKSWLTFGNNLGYSHIKSLGIGNTNSEFGGILSSAINLDPITPAIITDPTVANASPYTTPNVVRDANGNPYGISSLVQQEMANPLAYIQTHLGNNGWSDNFVGNAFVEIVPIKGLTIRSNLGSKYAFWGNESFTPLYYLNAATIGAKTAFYRASNRSLNYTWENTASYTRNFGLHSLTALVGTGAYVDNYVSNNMGVT